MFAIYKRELRSYFVTPLGYVFIAVFLAAAGFAFSILTIFNSLTGSQADTDTYFTIIIFSFAILLPLLTRTSFSEERRTRTEQLLLTSRVSLPGMVAGKFFAAYSVFGIAMLASCLFFTVLGRYGSPNGARIFGSVLAVFLVGAAFIAIGLFVSSLTENQLVAAVGTIAIMLFFLVIGFLAGYVNSPALRAVLGWVSVYSRFSNFRNGIFDFSALFYYLSLCFVFLFGTVRVFESRRWA